jgi:RND family efflux transporter MFP subunit
MTRIKKEKKMKINIYALVLGMAVINYSCSNEGNAEISNDKVDSGIAVTVMTLENEPFEEYLNLTGMIKANSQINIIAEESGILVDILKDMGSRVRKGQVLAILENKVTEAAAEQAEAVYQQAEIDFNSSKVLYGKKAISENQFKTAELTLKAAKAAYDLNDAHRQKLTIKAPISGYVNGRYVDMGGYINPSSPLFEIVDNSKMKVTIGVAQRFFRFIKEGSAVELTFDAFPDLTLNSKVNFVARSIDPKNGTFNVETTFKNPGQLAPEMIANIRLLKQKYDRSISVPIDAVIDSESGRYVFLADGNIARKTDIKIQAIQEERVMVEGLKQNDRLIIAGQRSLSDGDSLNIVE